MMDKEKNSEYFTAGELATLFGISKQTLLYYDKIDLLSPDFISANGYRRYSIKQYLDLEIIVNMRALDISIADIRKYLSQRGKEHFLKLLQEKRNECEKIIRDNQNTLKTLHIITNNIHSYPRSIPDYPTLRWYERRPLYITEIIKSDDAKHRILKFVRHSQKILRNSKISDKLIGWTVSRDIFFSKRNYTNSVTYFSFSPPHEQANAAKSFVLPAGLYLEIYFRGTFYRNVESLADRCHKFLEANNLQPKSDIFVLPIENHWFASNTDDYCNKIFIEVKPEA